jgi:hypothetical protein
MSHLSRPMNRFRYLNCVYSPTMTSLYLLRIHGVSLGEPSDSAIDVDQQVLVFRMKLLGAVVKV